MSINRLSRTTASLLEATQIFPTFESIVSTTLSQLHKTSTETALVIHPQALRFVVSTNSTHPPCTTFLAQLSLQSSLELTTTSKKLYLRGGKILSNGFGSGERGGEGVMLDVWELFYNIPIRRRLEALRDENETISIIRNMVTRIALTSPTKKLVLSTNNEIYKFDGIINHDALQSAFGLNLTWLRLEKRERGTIINGFIAEEGFTNSRYQVCGYCGVFDERIGEVVNQVWKRVVKNGRKRFPAYVVNVEGCFIGAVLQCALNGALGICNMMVKEDVVEVGMRKRPCSTRFDEVMLRGCKRSSRPLSDGRLSVQVSKKRPKSIENVYKRMVKSWKNPCLPSRSRAVATSMYDKRAVSITKDRICGMRIVGQVDKKFIIISDEEGLYAVDQHGASERFHYETLLKRCMKECDSHKLATPRHVSIPNELRCLENRVLANARKWGWVVDDDLRVTHVPELKRLKLVLECECLVEWFEDCFKGVLTDDGIPSVINRVMASAACHSAVRFGDKLSKDMCESIVWSLANCDKPFICAHGRPNIVPLVVFH